MIDADNRNWLNMSVNFNNYLGQKIIISYLYLKNNAKSI